MMEERAEAHTTSYVRSAGVTVASLALASCLFAPQSVVPLPTIPSTMSQAGSDTLIVMLPGRGDRMQTFLETGFVTDTEDRDFDVIVTDSHWGYYRNRTLTGRLNEDVILPARSLGYDNIWLLGISMGGLGSVLYASEYPDNIDGTILLAPFLGDRALIEEIMGSGGLVSWSGQSDRAPEYEVLAWRWLQTAMSESTHEIILGFGSDDRLAESYGPLLDAMPESHVFSRSGGHAWTTWTPLWRDIRSAGLLP